MNESLHFSQEHFSKSSRQRDLILHIVRSSRSHPTAEWIYDHARICIPHISLGTVYRNLSLLRDDGRIREISFQDGIRRYDGELREHDHIRCLECGNIEDVPRISPITSGEEVERLTGYHIHYHKLEFLGICPRCKRSLSYKMMQG